MTNLWDISSWQPITCLVTGRVWGPDDFLNEIAGRVGFLKAQGIGSGDVVFIYHHNSLEFLADLFAVWVLGTRAAALSPNLTLSEIKNLAAFAKPKAILIGGDQTLPEDKFKAPVLNLKECKGTAEKFSLGKQDFGLILFTSGTTGEPKGVVHTRSSIEKKITQNLEHFDRDYFERALCVLSSHFVAGLFSSIFTPLAAGGEVFLFPDPGIKGAGGLGALIDNNRITMVNSVPSLWNIILKSSKKPKANSLKFVSVVSAPLGASTQAAIKDWTGIENVQSLYGTTETGGWNTGFSGKVLGGEAAVLNKTGEISKLGEGELLLKTPSLFSGYFKREDLTKRALIDGWFKTGDLAAINTRGEISILGRVKTQINRAGVKILPEEVEALLETHPDVSFACVFAYADPVMGEGIAGAIENPLKEEIDFSALRTWCKSRIRAVAIPEKWFKVKKIPRTDRGKIDRKALQDHLKKKGQI